MTNWLKYLGISIPLTILKSWLFTITTISSSILILLPISLITYNNYYNSLIPLNNQFKLPLKFDTNDNKSNIINGFKDSDVIDSEVNYELNFELYVVCKPKESLFNVDKINYQFITSNYREEQDKDEDRDKDEEIFEGSFILNCDPYELYSRKNYIIPYNLRFLISPYLTKISQSIIIKSKIFLIKGYELINLNNLQIKLNDLNSNDYLIDDNYSYLIVNIKWNGFRYYLVKYYYSCFIIGSLLFFGIMSGFSILISYIMLYINNTNNNKR